MFRSKLAKGFKSVSRAFHVPTTEEMELAYIRQCVSREDLEFREREVSRGRFRSF